MSPLSRPAVLGLIGNTPLLEVTRLDTGICQLFLKLESQNPGGSIKDRIGLSIIEAAERDGHLKPRRHDRRGHRLPTPASGWDWAPAPKGYASSWGVRDRSPGEKILPLQNLGAQGYITRFQAGQGDPDNYKNSLPGGPRKTREPFLPPV